METKLLDGKTVRDVRAAALASEIASLGVKPKLVIVQVGDKEESNAYIRQKVSFGERIGCEVAVMRIQESASTEDVVRAVREANDDKGVHGIIIQLPLPQHIDEHVAVDSIDPDKDVDGLTAANVKLLWSGRKVGFMPATTKGILSLLEHYGIALEGKRVVIVGRSELVGKPTALALLNRDATVTVCHSKTERLEEITREADILMVAVGRPGLIGRNHVREGQVVVDVGINPVMVGGERRLVGDVDSGLLLGFVSALTPVPGGVGPMTVVSLFENLVEAYMRKQTISNL